MKKFKVSFEQHDLEGNIMGDDKEPIIFLHGAGQASAKSFDSLRQNILNQGISSIAFDMIGHGKTGGKLEGSTLKERTDQVMSIINHLDIREPLNILGRSMGGYTAIKLLEKYRIKNLILMVPGIYDKEVYNIPFGKKFSYLIRRKKSWENSDAWDLLKKFNGNLLILEAENDEVIPEKIINKIYESAKSVNSKEIYLVQKSPHDITRFLNENDKIMKVVSNKIKDKIKL